ncbi:MAG: sulfotransferase, partial [Cyclobacteriaceae bacterium]
MQVFVVGMHRSGTSVISRILNLMGLYFGSEEAIMKIGDDNPKGFWERRDVMELNDRLLDSIDCKWYKVSSLSGKVEFKEEAIKEIKEEAKNLILGMDSFRPWFIKDPRVCITLPFWLELVELPVVVFVSRNGEAVADSLKTRNHFPYAFGKALWEQYNFLALQNMGNLPHYHLDYDLFMSDPIKESGKLYNYLAEQGVTDLKMPSDKSINSFLIKKEKVFVGGTTETIGNKPSKSSITVLSESEKVIGDSLLLSRMQREEVAGRQGVSKMNFEGLTQKQNRQETEITALRREIESLKGSLSTHQILKKEIQDLKGSLSAQQVLKEELRQKKEELKQAAKEQSRVSVLEKELTKREVEILSLKRNEDELKRFVYLKSQDLASKIRSLREKMKKMNKR